MSYEVDEHALWKAKIMNIVQDLIAEGKVKEITRPDGRQGYRAIKKDRA